MKIKDQRTLYKLLKELGHEKVTEMLNRYIHDDDYGFYLEDEEAIIYLTFEGYFNSGDFISPDHAIIGFIQSNLDKGRKNFELKRTRERVRKVIKEAEKETREHFNIPEEVDDTIPLTPEQVERYKRIINGK